MDTYVIVRRNGWLTQAEVDAATARSGDEDARTQEDVAWIRSYILSERDGTLGTVCIFQASSPEAIRRHAAAADLPVDEIVKVADTLVERPDPVPAMSSDNQRKGDS